MFQKEAGAPEGAIVLIFDLEGFSKFFGQADIHYHVTKFLNRVFECFETIINGGNAHWLKGKPELQPFQQPIHQKFLGDGALYVWTYKKQEDDEVKEKYIHFLNNLWDFKANYLRFLDTIYDEIPLFDIPKRIRVGLASGSVYKLDYSEEGESEYIGYCINLASRLQGYCRELSFMASARIGYTSSFLEEHGYTKVVAKKIAGFPKEIIIVKKHEYEALDEQIKNELFEL